MRALSLIISREFLSRVKTKTFIITTLLMPVLMALMMALPAYLMSIEDTDIKTVYVIDNTNSYNNLFESNDTYTFVNISEDEKSDKKMDALLQIDRDLSEFPLAATFFSEQKQPPRELLRYINTTLTDAVKNQKVNKFTETSEIEPEVAVNLRNLLSSKETINVNTLRWDAEGSTSNTVGEVGTIIGMALTFGMLMFIMLYGAQVIQSVVEEKSNKIVEVIVSSVKPFDLMMGKIIGIGLTGIVQLLIWVVLGGVIATATLAIVGVPTDALSPANTEQALAMIQDQAPELNKALTEILSISWLQIGVCFIFYFIGGYLLFASLYAMFGSAANDSQEAQQLTSPLTIVLFIAFYAGYAAARNPEGTIAFWCSLIPFTSPFVMIVRAPFEVPLWEMALSIVLLFATAIFTTKIAAKIYRIGILVHGKKVSFKEIFKWFSYK